MNTLNVLLNQAYKAKFETYGSFNEGDEQHDILTCTKGKYDGEVIDIYYNYYTGEVNRTEISTQFKGQTATFQFN